MDVRPRVEAVVALTYLYVLGERLEEE